MSARWTRAERDAALAAAERTGVDLLVVGGGITGAGVLRDAASRGLRALLVERDDFAAGTSSRSSKMLHGGLRYIAEGQLGITYRSCRERDRLQELNPHLVQPMAFLFPSYAGGGVKPWQVRVLLFLYRLLAGFRPSSRYRILSPQEALALCPELRADGLQAAGLYHDARVDDARFVIESLKSARGLGAEAVNYAEVVGFEHHPDGRIRAARVRDRLGRRELSIPAQSVVNAAGPAVERVRGLGAPDRAPEMRPAKGVHLVVAADRIPAQATVTFEAEDGRHLFLSPWEDVALIGTTDTFTDAIDEPLATPEDVDYLLAAANRAFPRARLGTGDVLGLFAGVRPLVAPEESERPPSSVSREHRIHEDRPGFLSVAGGKLTLYRAMGEAVVDRIVKRLPAERRRAFGPSRTWDLPLREAGFEAQAFARELDGRFGLEPAPALHLVRTWGLDAEALLARAPEAWRRPIDGSHHLYAELAWSIATECADSLCDLLERRVRLAPFAPDQGLGALDRIVAVVAEAAGWDAERARAEARAYEAVVHLRYRPPGRTAQTSQSAA